VDEFRDKLVLSFKTETVKKITMEKAGISRALIFDIPEPSKADETKTDTPPETAGTWQFEDGTAADKTAVQDLLSSLYHLEAAGYAKAPEAKTLEKEKVHCKISLDNGEGLSLSLFEQPDKESLAGLSTSTPYAFTLDSYKAKDIISYVDKLLGLELEKTASE